MNKKNIEGKIVDIKEGLYKGEWGRVKLQGLYLYHIAIADDTKSFLVFVRSEFSVRSGQGETK